MLGPSSWRLSPGKCRAEYTEAVLSFCSTGRGRLRLKQHHVSRGSALSEGKELWALQLLGVPKCRAGASSVLPRAMPWGPMGAGRKEPGWKGQETLSPARGSMEGTSRALSRGCPSSQVGDQGFRRSPEVLALVNILSVQRSWMAWVAPPGSRTTWALHTDRKEAVS
jgi:hypothetical protein